MAKKTRRRYTELQRAAILADIEKNGLTQVAAAKKHVVSAVTIWQWKRAAKTLKRRSWAVQPRSASRGSLDWLVRSEVRDRIGELLPGIVRDEVASYLRQELGGKR